jgi:[ribosomal protein S18]-alanine N-acetyltransferase
VVNTVSIMRKPDELRTPVLDIVPMRRKHLKAIMPIEEVVYPRPWTLGVFHAEIELVRREQRFYIIGEIGEELVGYGGLLFTPDDAHITNIAVHPEWQRRGIATDLLFAPAGVRKKYYENVEDAMVMWCHEVSSPEYGARLREIEMERANAHR